ncbi:MAG: hypothetical protein ACKOAD_01015 [Gammaproteobacteria bacterium]
MLSFNEKISKFLVNLNQFQYRYGHSDWSWNFIFLHKKTKWYHISILEYQKTYYINLTTDEYGIKSLEVKMSENSLDSYLIKEWEPYIDSAQKWLDLTKKDWIKAHAMVLKNYPLNSRYGYISHALVRASLPDIYRLDQVLGQKKVKKFIKIAESRYFYDEKNTICFGLTANKYFEYCKIAYIAAESKNERINESLSGKELYERYADGRHEGLLEIDLDSQEEFAAWIDGRHPKKQTGGHPWEIKRGGNTTHIDLYVSRPRYGSQEGFNITVSARAITRLAEAISMFLAIHDAGLPIQISDPKAISRRLQAQDNIGIVPKQDSLHRANQHYPEHQDVYDVMHFDDLGRSKRRLKNMITWEPLPVLVPV